MTKALKRLEIFGWMMVGSAFGMAIAPANHLCPLAGRVVLIRLIFGLFVTGGCLIGWSQATQKGTQP